MSEERPTPLETVIAIVSGGVVFLVTALAGGWLVAPIAGMVVAMIMSPRRSIGGRLLVGIAACVVPTLILIAMLSTGCGGSCLD